MARQSSKVPSTPTVRSLARALGLSRSTVSNALRGSGRIAAATLQRVRTAAREAGYRHNPLAATLMSELRRSRGGTFRGVVAAVDLHEAGRAPHGPFHRELVAGATARAGELGYKLQEFVAGGSRLPVPRLDSVLQSRGIHGLLLLPAWHSPDFTMLDWTNYAGAYTDHNLERPPLHSVCCDLYRSVQTTLAHLRDRGYRRPGLFIETMRNERLHRRHSAAFAAFHRDGVDGEEEPVPPLITPTFSREAFVRWFRRHRPDVVLSHFTTPLDWMEECGARVPATHGFVCLNVISRLRPCAGLDLQPREIGSRGIELVIAQLQRNEYGVPKWPTMTTIPARWVEGPTLRRSSKPRRK